MADDTPVLFTGSKKDFLGVLRRGDVILYDTRSPVGGLVQWVDRSPVNHASIMKDEVMTLEAYLPADKKLPHVVLTDMNEMLEEDFHSAFALRHVDVQADPANVEGILRNIERYETSKAEFTTVDLVLLGPAALRRSGYNTDSSMNPTAMALVMQVLDACFGPALDRIPPGRAQVFCSELVYRCLVEDDTGLAVDVLDPISRTQGASDAELAAWTELREKETTVVEGMVDWVGDVNPDFVTPGDLWRSPQLQLVAHYQWPVRKKKAKDPLEPGGSVFSPR